MAELCGSLPRRHGRRRSRRSRSRHAKRSRSANTTNTSNMTSMNAREEVNVAEEVAKLRAEYDASMTSLRNTDSNSNVLAAPETPDGERRPCHVKGPVSGDLQKTPRKDVDVAGNVSLESTCPNKTDTRFNLGETDKTECLIPKSASLVKQVEALRTSVMDKCEPLVNGMSFKSALESRKEAPKSFEVDERKPPVIYSRKNSLLNDDNSARAPKGDADWRRSSIGDKHHPKNDAPTDRKFSQSREKYFVRRNSLPREDVSSRRNSLSQDETCGRKNSFSKSEFSSRRNSFTKADYERRNSEKSYARKNSFSKEDKSSRKNSFSQNEPLAKGSKEPNSRRGSFSDNPQSFRKNSFSRNEGPPKNDEFGGRQRIVYASKPFKKDSPNTNSRRNSFSNAGPYIRKNSWSQSDHSSRSKELEQQIQHEHQTKDSSVEQNSKYSSRSDNYYQSGEGSCSNNEQSPKKISSPENELRGSELSPEGELNSGGGKTKDTHTSSTSSNSVSSLTSNSSHKITSESLESSGPNKFDVRNDVLSNPQSAHQTETSVINGSRLSLKAVPSVEHDFNATIRSVHLTVVSPNLCHNSSNVSASCISPEQDNLTSQIGNTALNNPNPASATLIPHSLHFSSMAPGHHSVLPGAIQEPGKNESIMSDQKTATAPGNASLQSKNNRFGSVAEFKGSANELSGTSNPSESAHNYSETKISERNSDRRPSASAALSNGLTIRMNSTEEPRELNSTRSVVKDVTYNPSLVEVCKNICEEFSASIDPLGTSFNTVSENGLSESGDCNGISAHMI